MKYVMINILFILSFNLLAATVSTENLGSFDNCKFTENHRTFLCDKDGKKLVIKKFRGQFLGFYRDGERVKRVNITDIFEEDYRVIYSIGMNKPNRLTLGNAIFVPFLESKYADIADNELLIDRLFKVMKADQNEDPNIDKIPNLKKEIHTIQGNVENTVTGAIRTLNDLDVAITINGDKINCEASKSLSCSLHRCDGVKGGEIYVYKDRNLENGYMDWVGFSEDGSFFTDTAVEEVFIDGKIMGKRSEPSYPSLFSHNATVPAKYRNSPQVFLNNLTGGYNHMMLYEMSKCGPHFTNKYKQAVNRLHEDRVNSEMVHLVDIVNGMLIGNSVNFETVKDDICEHNGMYYTPTAYKHASKLQGQVSSKTISMEKAKELFDMAKNNKDIAWEYTEDGCYARAHLMAEMFEKEGVHTDKAWVNGSLIVDNGTPKNLKDDQRWVYHVAPIVYVDDGANGVKKMVIDPSIESGPVEVNSWLSTMNVDSKKVSEVSYPFSSNASVFDNYSLAYSSSEPYREVHYTGLTYEQSLEEARERMHFYKNGGSVWDL